MLNVVIPDPGLREYGGHHPAMINSLANTKAVINGHIQLNVLCNQGCSDEFINSTCSEHVTIKKHFKTDFYQHFYQTPKLSELNGYINQLSKEYLSVFKLYAPDVKSTNKTLFLYHTLNWEHSVALAAAISIYNKRNTTPLQHCVFLMYNPIKNNDQGQLNTQHFLNFKVGFSLLAKQKQVRCFAGEEELQCHFQSLLNKPVAIHPCGLLSQKSTEQQKKKSVILFTGDAKLNKGFLSLPAIAKQLTQQIHDKDAAFIIQYTLTNDNEALKQADKALCLLAKGDSRIQLTTHFWSHGELHDNFAQASSILFKYDSQIYQNQSSGVLWLAALYELNMVFLNSNWLTREAERLACQYSLTSMDNLTQNVSKYLEQFLHCFDKVDANNYRAQLFQNIDEWLMNIKQIQ